MKGSIVTLDAMGCQKEIAQTIVEQGADYVLALKANQGHLHQQVKDCFNVTEWDSYRDFAQWGHATQESGHGRRDSRRYVALDCSGWENATAWSGLQSVVMVASLRNTGVPGLVEKRSYISSLAPDSERLGHAIRRHWETENRLHWCLDMSFNEDASRIRNDQAPENLNVVKKMAMNLLRVHPLKRSLPKKRLKACLNSQFLDEVLGQN